MKYLIFFFFSFSLCAEPVVKLPERTQTPVNLIRKMLREIPKINEERKNLGLDPVINLSIGQPHVAMNTQVLDPLIQYLEGLKTMSADQLSKEMGYSHSAGLFETRLWISRSLTQDFPEVEEGFLPEEVMVTNGAAGAMTNALKVLVEEGDAVAVFAPYFAAYKSQVKDTGAELIKIQLDENRSYADLLEQTLSSNPQVKVFVWNDPNNPLGTKASKEEMVSIAKVLERYPNLIVIHDEVYRDLIHFQEPLSLLNIAPSLRTRSIIIRSLAKDILGAPGVRAGMIAAPVCLKTIDGTDANLIALMANEQLRDIVSVSVLVQKVLVFALQSKLMGESLPWTRGVVAEYARNTGIVAKALENMGLPPVFRPEGAFYVMADGSSLIGKAIPDQIGSISGLNQKIGYEVQSDKDIASLFLHAAGVAVVPGIGFQADVCSFRVSCAQDEDNLLDAMGRIEKLLSFLE